MVPLQDMIISEDGNQIIFIDSSQYTKSNDVDDKIVKPADQRFQHLEATSFEPDSGPEVPERNENIAQPPVKVSLLSECISY